MNSSETTAKSASCSTRVRTRAWEASPVLALAIGLLITGLLARSEWQRSEAAEIDRFRQHCTDFANLFDKSLRLQLQAVLNLREWCTTRESINDRAWEHHALTLHLPTDYPSISMVGFAELVLDEVLTNRVRLKQHLARLRSVHGPDYKLTLPPGGRSDFSWYHFPVVHSSYARGRIDAQRPFQNYGVDLNQNPDLSSAINWTVGQDLPSISGLQPFSNTAPGQRGVYLFHTVYGPHFAHEQSHDTNLSEFPGTRTSRQIAEAERLLSYRGQCRGVVFATVNVQLLVAELVAHYGSSANFACYASVTRRPFASQDQCLFDNRSPNTDAGTFDVTRQLFGRTFLLRFAPPTMAQGLTVHRTVLWIASLGLFGTFASVWFFRLQIRAVQTEQATSAALRQSQTQLKQLLRDRDRISRDLHDGTIQSLYAVGLGLSQLRRSMSSEAERQRLTANLLELENVVSELRGYLVEFDPGVSLIQTPGEALAELVQRLQHTTSVPIHFTNEVPQDRPWPGAVVLDSLHMAREGIGNALRHGRAGEIRLRLHSLPGEEVELVIDDNGVGFDPNAPRSRGHGLQNLHLRTRAWNGRLRIESKPGGPTRLRLQFVPHAPSVNPSDL